MNEQGKKVKAIVTNGSTCIDAYIAESWLIDITAKRYLLFKAKSIYGEKESYSEVRLPIDKTILLTLKK